MNSQIFLPGSGAFFVNYMLQSIFVSLTLAMTSLVDRMFRWYSLSHVCVVLFFRGPLLDLLSLSCFSL